MLALLAREAIGVAELARIHGDRAHRAGFAEDALSALRQLDAAQAWRAAWLLNRCARDPGLSERVVFVICEEAAGLTHWVARLLVCQLLAHTGCPVRAREIVFPFLRTCVADRHATIRAWACTVLSAFADDPDLGHEIAAILERARTDPAKCVQARLRQLDTRARRFRAPRRVR